MRSDNTGEAKSSELPKAPKKTTDDLLNDLVQEVAKTEETFHVGLKALMEIVLGEGDEYLDTTRDILAQRNVDAKNLAAIRNEIRKMFSADEFEEFKSLLAPYRRLANSKNIFTDYPADSTVPAVDRVNALLTQMDIDSSDFKKNEKRLTQATVGFLRISEMMGLLRERLAKKSDSFLIDKGVTSQLKTIVEKTLPDFLITGAQRGPRYLLFLADIDKKVEKATEQKYLDIRTRADDRRVVIGKYTKVMNDYLMDLFDILKKSKVDNLKQEIFKLSYKDEKEFLKAFMHMYANSYIDYRSKGLTNTVKEPFLIDLENAVTNSKAFKNADKDNEKRGGKTKSAEVKIFSFISGDDELRKSVVSELFSRAMIEGLALGNKQLFLNSVKALARMGDGVEAMKDWNKLAGKYGDALKFPETAEEILKLKESKISDRYDETAKNKNVLADIKKDFAPEILVSYLKSHANSMQSDKDKDEVDNLIDELEKNKNAASMHSEMMAVFKEHYLAEKLKAKDYRMPSDPVRSLLTDAMRASGTNAKIDPALPNKDLLAIVVNVYLDIYLEERTKLLTSKRTEFLTSLESSIKEMFNLPQNTAQNIEEQILQHAQLVDGGMEAIVQRLFGRAMVEGFSGKQKEIYMNAAKMVSGMGNAATAEWNRLVTANFGAAASLQLPPNKVDKQGVNIAIKSSDISPLYEAALKQKPVVAKVNEVFATQVFLNMLYAKQSGLSASDFKKLYKLAGVLQPLKGDPQKFHDAFLLAYVNIYSKEWGTSGPILKFLNETLENFQSYNNLFVGKDSYKKGKPDAELFASASPEQAAVIVKELVGLAITKTQQLPFLDGKAKADALEGAVAAGKAVVRLNGVEHWQAAAKLSGKPMFALEADDKGKINDAQIKDKILLTAKEFGIVATKEKTQKTDFINRHVSGSISAMPRQSIKTTKLLDGTPTTPKASNSDEPPSPRSSASLPGKETQSPTLFKGEKSHRDSNALSAEDHAKMSSDLRKGPK